MPNDVEEFPQDQEYTCVFAVETLITVDTTNPLKLIANWRRLPEDACDDRTVDSYILRQRVVKTFPVNIYCHGLVCFILGK